MTTDRVTNVYAHWHLNETTGTSVSDCSGNARNGTIITGYGTSTWKAGKLNNCLDLVGNYVNFGNIASFERTDSFSFELWYNFTSTANPGCIFGRIDTAYDYRGYMLRIEAGKLTLLLANSFNINSLRKRTQSTFNDGAWHHIVVTYNGSSTAAGILIYVDNVLQTCDVIYDNLSDTIVVSKDLYMSNRPGLGTPANGSYDEVLIYSKVLTADEVTWRYNSGTGREPEAEISHTMTDLIGNLDTKTRLATRIREKTDIVGVKDTRTRLAERFRSKTDVIGIKDTKTRLSIRFRTWIDKIGSLDTKIRIIDRFRTFIEIAGGLHLLDTLKSCYHLFGQTLDADGTPIGFCNVYVFRTDTNVLVGQTVSDVDGNYEVYTISGVDLYVVAFKPNTPNVQGVTDNTLQASHT